MIPLIEINYDWCYSTGQFIGNLQRLLNYQIFGGRESSCSHIWVCMCAQTLEYGHGHKKRTPSKGYKNGRNSLNNTLSAIKALGFPRKCEHILTISLLRIEKACIDMAIAPHSPKRKYVKDKCEVKSLDPFWIVTQ